MSVISNIGFLNKAIQIQREAIRFRVVLTALVIIIGLSFVVYGLFSGSEISEKLRLVLPIAGALITSVSGFPLKEIYSRKNTILSLTYMKSEYERIQAGNDDTASPKLENLNQRFNKFVDKILGG